MSAEWRFTKTTRRAQFLADMDRIIPWAELNSVVEPFYPKVNEAGGRFTDLNGAPITLQSTSVLATNGRMHAPILAALRQEGV